jgi:hypothetical protein
VLYAEYQSDKQAAQDDRAQSLLTQEISRDSLVAQSVPNNVVQWIFDVLSSLHVGLGTVSLLQAIKHEEELLAESRSSFRSLLHAESKALAEEHLNLQAEIDGLCDQVEPTSALFLMDRLNAVMVQLQISLVSESEAVDLELRLRSDKERQIIEECDAVGRVLQRSELLRKQRVDARESLHLQMQSSSHSIKSSMEQLAAAIPCLQNALAQAAAAGAALRLLIVTQSHESCTVVLQPVSQTLSSEFESIYSVRDSVAALLAQHRAALDAASDTLTQVAPQFQLHPLFRCKTTCVLGSDSLAGAAVVREAEGRVLVSS